MFIKFDRLLVDHIRGQSLLKLKDVRQNVEKVAMKLAEE